MTTAVDQGKLIVAKLAGDCAECGGTIAPGQMIYFSRQLGSRHRGCVDRGEPPSADAARPAAPSRDARDASPRNAAPDARDGDPGRLPFGDDAPRARDGAPASQGDGGGDDAYRAPARDTEFGRAGDRDAARRELAAVIRLLIEALQRVEKVLS